MSLTNTASTSRRAALEARLRAAGDQPDRIPPHPGPPDRPPLSYAQERFWFLEQIHPGTVAFQLPWAVRIRGSFDPDAMVTALRAAYARHDALRTVFAENDGVATGRIAPAEPFVVAKVDLTGDAPERRARAWLRDMFTTPLSLTDGPLLRTAVLTLADDDHVIALCVHHAVCDGWSIELLMRDVWNAYRTIVNGGSYEPPAIPVRYADAAAWQRSRVEGNEGAFGLEYWREQLVGRAAAGATD